jgi:shikimate kinase
MNVVLIGMKHCGKSTIGRALAERLGCAFYDVDPMIAAMHACDKGERLSVRDIFTRYGEDYFHRIEGHVVCELYLKLDRPDSASVLALGGRTALNTTVLELLRAIGTTIYLRLDPDTIYRRIERAGLPPFLQGADPAGKFLKLYHEREPQYCRLADIVLNLDNRDVAINVDRVMACIKEHEHGRQ